MKQYVNWMRGQNETNTYKEMQTEANIGVSHREKTTGKTRSVNNNENPAINIQKQTKEEKE